MQDPGALVAATGVGFAGISLLTDSRLFFFFFGQTEAGVSGSPLGRTGSHPADTCPGRTAAAGLGFDSCEAGAGTLPALRFPGQRLEAPAAALPSPSAQLLLFKS